MKAITVLQPFATLIALGEKHFETRSWKTDYRGELLIHAGKGTQYMYLWEREAFYSVLEKHGYIRRDRIPLGAIIAKVNLTDCLKVKESTLDFGIGITKAVLENGMEIKDNELKFGDYTRGRYAWKLENVEMLKESIPVKGQQRLWNFNFKEDK